MRIDKTLQTLVNNIQLNDFSFFVKSLQEMKKLINEEILAHDDSRVRALKGELYDRIIDCLIKSLREQMRDLR